MEEEKDKLMLEYFVPIKSKAVLNGDFTIEGIAINETTTTNGHTFIGEELKTSAKTLIGVPLLKDHDNSVDAIVGRVNSAHFDELQRTVPFKAMVKDKAMQQKIRDGLINSVSVGAYVDTKDIEETEDGDIIPHNIQFKELSLVAIPAAPAATFTVALNNAYKGAREKADLKSIERGNETNMSEEEKKTVEPETPVEPEVKEEPKEEAEVETPEEKEEPVEPVEEKIRKVMKEELAKLKEADIDEPEAKEEPKEEPKVETKEEEEEDEDEEETVEEKSDYAIKAGHRSFSVERKSYVYN